MLIVRKNIRGYVWAIMNYHIVDETGRADTNGKFCYVEEVWIHEDRRSRKTLSNIVKEEHAKYPQVETIYYTQNKHDKRWKKHDIRRFYNGRNDYSSATVTTGSTNNNI